MSSIITTVEAMCDYYVYVRDSSEVIAYELTPDDLEKYYGGDSSLTTITLDEKDVVALPLSYGDLNNLKKDEDWIEVFGIKTTLVYKVDQKSRVRELIWYKPNLSELADDVALVLLEDTGIVSSEGEEKANA